MHPTASTTISSRPQWKESILRAREDLVEAVKLFRHCPSKGFSSSLQAHVKRAGQNFANKTTTHLPRSPTPSRCLAELRGKGTVAEERGPVSIEAPLSLGSGTDWVLSRFRCATQLLTWLTRETFRKFGLTDEVGFAAHPDRWIANMCKLTANNNVATRASRWTSHSGLGVSIK